MTCNVNMAFLGLFFSLERYALPAVDQCKTATVQVALV
jgi:hypothetical protein